MDQLAAECGGIKASAAAVGLDLYDCEILATLCDKIGGQRCIAHQTSLLSDSKGQKSKKAKKEESSKEAGTGRKSVRKEGGDPAWPRRIGRG